MFYADDLQIFASASIDSLPSTVSRLEKCISAIRSWLASSMLTLNEAKTECLVTGTPPMLKKCTVSHVLISNHNVPFSSSVRNLGVTLDSSLNLKAHIATVCAKSFGRLRLVSRLKKIISSSHYSMLVNALVLSGLDYCSSIYLGLPQTSTSKLQDVLNGAFRSANGLRKFDRIGEAYRHRGW